MLDDIVKKELISAFNQSQRYSNINESLAFLKFNHDIVYEISQINFYVNHFVRNYNTRLFYKDHRSKVDGCVPFCRLRTLYFFCEYAKEISQEYAQYQADSIMWFPLSMLSMKQS